MDNNGLILIAQARRLNRPYLPENYIDLGFKLVDLINSHDIIVTVRHKKNQANNVGSFSTDNYGSLPLFFMEREDLEQETVVVIRRFEDGPKINNKIPYKTVCSMIYFKGQWFDTSEENLKLSYMTDAKTGEPLELEPGILFSTVSEMFPELLTDGL